MGGILSGTAKPLSGSYDYPVRGLFHPQFLGSLGSFSYDLSFRELLGFSTNNSDAAKHLAIPFWFPTSLSAAVLWFAWRKTRPKVKGRAFPVEGGAGDGGKMGA